jgi:hypothetical protein
MRYSVSSPFMSSDSGQIFVKKITPPQMRVMAVHVKFKWLRYNGE